MRIYLKFLLRAISVFSDRAYEDVDKLKKELCDEYCRVCPDNCCSGRLNVSFRDNANFRGIPIVRSRWQRPPRSEAYISDRRFLFFGKKHLIGRCPYLTDEGRCAVHEKTDRPADCVDYPLYIANFLFGRILKAEKSCFIFTYPKNCRKVLDLGRKLDLPVIFND